jgi:hypothetical protein
LPPLVTDEHLSLLEFLRQYKLQAFSQVLQEAEFDVAALQLSNLEDMAEVGICAAGAKEIMFCVEKLNKTLMFKKQREQKLFADKMGSQEKRGGGGVPQMTMHKLEAPPPALLQMQHWSLEQAIGWCTAFVGPRLPAGEGAAVAAVFRDNAIDGAMLRAASPDLLREALRSCRVSEVACWVLVACRDEAVLATAPDTIPSKFDVARRKGRDTKGPDNPALSTRSQDRIERLTGAMIGGILGRA